MTRRHGHSYAGRTYKVQEKDYIIMKAVKKAIKWYETRVLASNEKWPWTTRFGQA